MLVCGCDPSFSWCDSSHYAFACRVARAHRMICPLVFVFVFAREFQPRGLRVRRPVQTSTRSSLSLPSVVAVCPTTVLCSVSCVVCFVACAMCFVSCAVCCVPCAVRVCSVSCVYVLCAMCSVLCAVCCRVRRVLCAVIFSFVLCIVVLRAMHVLCGDKLAISHLHFWPYGPLWCCIDDLLCPLLVV